MTYCLHGATIGAGLVAVPVVAPVPEALPPPVADAGEAGPALLLPPPPPVGAGRDGGHHQAPVGGEGAMLPLVGEPLLFPHLLWAAGPGALHIRPISRQLLQPEHLLEHRGVPRLKQISSSLLPLYGFKQFLLLSHPFLQLFQFGCL